MKIDKPNCPVCGDELEGTVDTLIGVAYLTRLDDGTFQGGDYTRICWNSAESDVTDEGTLVQCRAGHQWRAHITYDD